MFDNLMAQAPGANVSEQDFRLNILNALLQTPHRNLEPYMPLFEHIAKTDPLFFGHLAAWYSQHGTVKDLNQLFSAFLAVSSFSPEHREAGLALLSEMPPYMVERVFRIIKGGNFKGKFQKGIANSVPRSFRTAVTQYLREREGNQMFFDSAALQSRKQLRSLYASLRIKPSPYAQAVLFADKPPEGSKAAVIKKIANSKDPNEQARLILENKIPFRLAVSMIESITPSTIMALVGSMTPQEVINNLGSLQRKGATNNAEIRKVIEEKLEKAKTDKRVSALKTRQALANTNVDADLAKKVTEVGDKRIKAGGVRIKKSTAILVDKSASLTIGIDVGKQLAAVIAPNCDKLHVFAFDTMCYPITPKGNDLSHWEAAFKGINANGGTSIGAPIAKLLKDRVVVEQFIVVTDQDETTPPYFVNTLQKYSAEFGINPNVIILNVGRHVATLERNLKIAGITVDTMDYKGDYYSLPSIIPMLAGGSRLDLLSEIMDTPLPARESEKELVTA